MHNSLAVLDSVANIMSIYVNIVRTVGKLSGMGCLLNREIHETIFPQKFSYSYMVC